MMQRPFFTYHPAVQEAAQKALDLVKPALDRIDRVTEQNQQKVLAAFIDNRVSESHFAASTGYGYDDRGRDLLDRVFADALGAEDALVRTSFLSGTHTLGIALFGVLRPGDVMLSVTGLPYDTIHSVIGLRGEGQGSLKDFGVGYRQVDLMPDGSPDFDAIADALTSDVKMVYLQRSRGYSLRPTLSAKTIGEVAQFVKQRCPDVVVMLDNCYGEFVETVEPVELGVDLMAGSLIKNAGGGIAPTGGYIAGRSDLVELCSYRHTVPGVGREIGATLGHTRDLFMGLFHAPHVTGEALKTAAFAAALMQQLGYDVTPRPLEERYDIIQAIQLRDRDSLIAFCQGMQAGAPIDAFVTPEPWDMPGYDSQVIMAAGAFTLGASIELSADAPLREPWAVWMQGGLNFHSGKVGVMLAASHLMRALEKKAETSK
ncbi:methionine gamma-lyase family protein [Solibaculum mannosilyticum]|nr:Methionine gamma-lyase [Eubacteriaceae bacterium CHKCI005]